MDSREKIRQAIYGTGSLSCRPGADVGTEKTESVKDNEMPCEEELAKREKEAFLEGYRYAIRVLEEGIVKDRL